MARRFNGVDECLQGPVTTYKPTPNWTMSVHAATSVDPALEDILGGRSASGRGWGLRRLGGGTIRLMALGTGQTAVSTSGVWPSDGEHHAITVRVAGGMAYFYVDGADCGSAAYVGPTEEPTFPWTIGAFWDGTDDRPESHWNGSIAEVAIWHHDIGDADAKALARYTPPVIGGMAYYWPLGGFAGRNDREWSGRMAELTPINSPAWIDHPPLMGPSDGPTCMLTVTPRYVADAGATITALEAAATGSHVVPRYAADAGATITASLATATGWHGTPTYRATATLPRANATAASTGSHVVPRYVADAGATITASQATATGWHGTPTYRATATLSRANATAAATGSHVVPRYVADAGATITASQATATGWHGTPTYRATATLSRANVTATAAGSHVVPRYVADAGVTIVASLATATGWHGTPTYRATATLSRANATATAAGSHVVPRYVADAGVTIVASLATATGWHGTPTYRATAALERSSMTCRAIRRAEGALRPWHVVAGAVRVDGGVTGMTLA